MSAAREHEEGTNKLRRGPTLLTCDPRGSETQGKDGVSIVKTASLIVIAHYVEGIQPGLNVSAVEGLADHLVGSGY